MKLLANLDLNSNELQNAKIQNLASYPSTPTAGIIFFHTGDKTFYGYSGSAWLDLGKILTGDAIVTLINACASIIDDNNLSASANDAITKKHSQNTDTGTSSSTFQIGSGVKIKNNGGNLDIRNSGDTAYADFNANNATVNGALTVLGNTTIGNVSTDTVTVIGTIDAQGNKITNVGSPTLGTDVVTKDYADGLRAGITLKDPVRVTTPVNLASSYASNILTASANGVIVIDGVTLALNDRVLVMNQTTGLQNGLYFVSQIGDVSNPWKLTRTTDADNSPTGEVIEGLTVWVDEGATLSNTRWVLTTSGTITLGTTSLAFTKDFQASDILGGTGITKIGNTFNIDATVATLTGIQTLTNKSLTSPTLTGIPVAPTASVSTNSTQVATTAFVLGQVGTANPVMNGTATVGTSLLYARQDHVHPSDTTKANLASPALTGTPTAPTASVSTNTTQLATTAFVLGQVGTANPVMNGTATVGTSYLYSRQDHIHPSDTTKAPIASPTFTGIATLPINSVSDGLLMSLNASVACAGTTQGTATALTKDINIISSGTGGVVVQGATTGKVIVIYNKTASAISVYPASGHYFDGLAVNTPITLNVSGFIEMYGYSTTQWITTQNAQVNWSQVLSKPTTLAGYGIADGVANTVTVNGHPLSSNVTVTATDVSLGNVTNNAQIKKIASAVSGNIVTWSGTTGDTVADSGKALPIGSIVGTSDTQTLTNKTLTSATANTPVTADNSTSVATTAYVKSQGYTTKYATNVGDGASTSITITHNLNSLDVSVTLRDVLSPANMMMCDVQFTDANNIKLIFATAPTSGQYRVIVIG
jgi:hypothetical protein